MIRQDVKTNQKPRPLYARKCAALIGMAFLLSLTGAWASEEPKLGEIYNRTAQYHGPRRNPVILIPGILGSTLEKKETRKIVWGGFTRDYANPGTAEGARSLALPMERGVPLSRLKDNVVATSPVFMRLGRKAQTVTSRS